MFQFKQKGNLDKTEKYLQRLSRGNLFDGVEKLAQAGVEALRNATSVDSGKTADSWSYEIKESKGVYTIAFHNTNVNDGVNIAILLQYDHATGTGGFVQGRDYINPALASIFDQMVKDVWKEVSKI